MNCDDGQATSDFVDARSGVKSLGNHRGRTPAGRKYRVPDFVKSLRARRSRISSLTSAI